MLRSMTAYGRFNKETSMGWLAAEIHSVNRKALDLSIHLPKDFLRFEIEIRKWLTTQLERGQLTVRITLQQDPMDKRIHDGMLNRLLAIKGVWNQIAIQLGLDPDKEIGLKFLVDQMGAFSSFDQEIDQNLIRQEIKDAVFGALKQLVSMKEEEGKALLIDIEGRLKTVHEALGIIEERRKKPLLKHQQKMRERLKEIGPLTPDTEERVYREIALLAEKIDVTEEIVRINSHLQQFEMQLKTAEKAIGRTLDFLLQEMNREANTLAAKSIDIEICLAVVKIKSELEKIREQAQNIE